MSPVVQLLDYELQQGKKSANRQELGNQIYPNQMCCNLFWQMEVKYPPVLPVQNQRSNSISV